MAELDRRIQLRENVHEVVVAAAQRRGVPASSLVSIAVYEYLRNCGELGVTSVTNKPKPKPYVASTWVDDEDEETWPSDG
jgi:hypothetical protein